MLRIENLEVYGLQPLSFEVSGGECVAVQGPSGSGKTLLLRAISDLDSVAGRIYLNGTERNDVSGPEWRKQVRYLAAEPGWWGETPREHFGRSRELQKLVPALGLKVAQIDQSLSELSTGERQRFALARAALDSPPVLLLDEPTGALDEKATAQAEKLIKTQLKAGQAVVLVSHDPDQVKRLANRKFVIQGGKLKAHRI